MHVTPLMPLGGALRGTLPNPDLSANGILQDQVFARRNSSSSVTTGSGDVVGPSSATDNATARFDATTGKLIQNSVLLVADTTGAISRNGGGGIQQEGTNTNDSASSGQVGEYIESIISTATNVPAISGVYGDFTSISLTAGDWDVTIGITFTTNGATVTRNIFGVSITSGNNSTGLLAGDSVTEIPPCTAANNAGSFISGKRFSLSATTTIYFKIFSTYSIATPQATGRLSARRAR